MKFMPFYSYNFLVTLWLLLFLKFFDIFLLFICLSWGLCLGTTSQDCLYFFKILLSSFLDDSSTLVSFGLFSSSPDMPSIGVLDHLSVPSLILFGNLNFP